MPQCDPLDYPCPKCGAGVNAKCRNYKNRACAPHRQRKPKHIPNVQSDADYADSEAIRRRVAGKHATDLAQAVSVCGWFPDGKYARWVFRDRTGARPDVVVYRCYREGGNQRGPAEIECHGLDVLTERLGPPFLAFFTNKPGGDDSPGGFGFRWSNSWNEISVPTVRTAGELKAAAENRRSKAVARVEDEAAKLAEWKRRNETPSMLDALGVT